MLRALAGYFFGGPQDDVQQEQLECETKEVNDWLVVNMPDQPEDNIDFDEEADDEMQLEDMDDVLNCLSTWFTIDPEPPFEDKRIVEPSSLPRIKLLFTQDSPSDEFSINLAAGHRVDRPLWTSLWHMIPLQMRYKQISDGLKCRKMVVGENEDWRDHQRVEVSKDLFQQRLRGKRVVKTSDVTCHPVYSKTYVNHRHPSMSPPKTDLLQKIKDLEPEQRATQQATKKHMTRGQMNRQNKNYIYDTSTKKNRRKNLQRNPSGANNNRKCNY